MKYVQILLAWVGIQVLGPNTIDRTNKTTCSLLEFVVFL